MSQSLHKYLAWTGLISAILMTIFIISNNQIVESFCVTLMIFNFIYQVTFIAQELIDRGEVKNGNFNKK